MRNEISRNGLLLAGFTLVTTAILSFIYWLSAPRIEAQVQQRTQSLLNQVLPSVEFDNDLIASCSTALIGNDIITIYRATYQEKPAALIIDSVTPNGYNGDIRFLVSLLANGKIGGVRVLEHSETPGLGDKIELRIDNWILDFSGTQADSVNDPIWAVKKDGGQFDQFTGATITPRAVVSGVGHIIQYALANQETLYAADSNCAAEQTS